MILIKPFATGVSYDRPQAPTQVFSCEICEILKKIWKRLLLVLELLPQTIAAHITIFRETVIRIFKIMFYINLKLLHFHLTLLSLFPTFALLLLVHYLNLI